MNYIGIEVLKSGFTFTLSKKKYIHDLLVKTKMEDCNVCVTPMVPSPKLSQLDGEVFEDHSL